MAWVLVCPDDFLFRLAGSPPGGEPPVCLTESQAAAARIRERGGTAYVADLDKAAGYRRLPGDEDDPMVVAVPSARRGRVLAALRAARPTAPVVLLTEEGTAGDDPPGVTTVPATMVARRVLEPALQRATTRARVDRLRAHFASAERVLILIQDDPDPDAIASALALRVLLGRNKTAAPIATFGTITRPENRAMTRILEIDVEPIKLRALEEYDMVAMVDAQQSLLEAALGDVDLIIDHHPCESTEQATHQTEWHTSSYYTSITPD